MRHSLRLLTLGLAAACATAVAARAGGGEPRDLISLAGEWQLKLDPANRGITERWFASDLPDRIALPGTVTAAGFGRPGPAGNTHDGPQPVRTYAGRAWYRRAITIPDSWTGRRIVLRLERTYWVSGLWVNGRFVGMRNSLAVPHEYELGPSLAPGRNELAVLVDNGGAVKDYQEDPGRPAIPTLGPAGGRHCEQGDNGILGRIELEAADPLWIARADAYPELAAHRVRVRVRINSQVEHGIGTWVVMQVAAPHAAAASVEIRRHKEMLPGENVVEATLDLKPDTPTWSEFAPDLCELTVSLSGTARDRAFRDVVTVPFGMRELTRAGTQLLLNGRPVFLRGRVDSAVFPLTGHAPMDVAGWRKILATAREYGLNHFRFHSWCPPEAAFQAADEMGFLFHIEPTSFSTAHYEDTPAQACDYAKAECLRIIDAYGNHPSFGFLSVGGNEQLSMGAPYDDVRERRQQMLMARLEAVRRQDPRHLYTCTTHPWTQGRTDDYYVSGWGKANLPDGHRVRLYGCNWGGPDLLKGSRFIESPPETMTDYRRELEGIDAPVITHEVGQWAVFPDIAETVKYTGVYRPAHLDAVRALLDRHGLLDQAADFVRASGQLSLRLYREEVESALRTPGLAGIDLLDLIDYPWQRTATVGILDAFWDSKGLITPEAWRAFCSPVVPLARLPRRTWTRGERFSARLEVANYGPADLPDAVSNWTLSLADGRVVASGELAARSIPRGGLTSLGSIESSLEQVEAPAKLMLTVSVGRPAQSNSWELWVYDEPRPPAMPASVQLFRAWGEPARAALQAGGKVLLLPDSRSSGNSLPGIFTPVYWSWLYFKDRQVGTMGLLCDPRHPALAMFPTEFHSNWQWWEPITHSRTMILDSLPVALRPTVQVIDRFDQCRRLGVLFEARVGAGRLAVCSIDLESDLANRPVSAQLRRSLLSYMDSDRFRPAVDVAPAVLDGIFTSPATSRAP